MAQDNNTNTSPLLIVDDGSTNDRDSAYNDFIGGENYQSVMTSSILEYVYDNGRRFYAFSRGEYVLPDEEEQQVMDILHHVYNLVLGGELHLAPISKQTRRALDLGTGTGIWAMDFADQYPSAYVIGNDRSSLWPQRTPPNCRFEVNDFETEWNYSQPFDYIHGREIVGAITDLDKLVKQAFNHLESDGFLELQFLSINLFSDDDSLGYAPNIVRLAHGVQEASVKSGKVLANMDGCSETMIEVGFKDVTCKIVRVPLSPWPEDPKQKEIGKYMPQATMTYSYALLSKVLGWNREQIEGLLAHVKKELNDLTIHAYLKLHLVYGKKP